MSAYGDSDVQGLQATAAIGEHATEQRQRPRDALAPVRLACPT